MSDQLSFGSTEPEKPKEKIERKPERSAKEPTILSVSQLNAAIKTSLESKFKLVWIRGEISNFTAHGSGHFYFSLKDGKSQISAVMFRGANSHLNFKPKVGDEVIARARVSVYVPRGNYQIVVEVMEPVGAGAMQRKFEELKRKLAAEGLFSAERKKKLPLLPQKIAVITSPTGAAIRDILNVLGRRYPAAQVLVIPAVVQGEGAVNSLQSALRLLERLNDVDVAIIGRGGGSIEDLWAFNDETLARMIADSKIPIISAVGHEIDFTISDFVADLRAPTPSAAAEVVAQSAHELAEKVRQLTKRIIIRMQNLMRERGMHLGQFEKRLIHPSRRLQELAQRCDDLMIHLTKTLKLKISDEKKRIDTLKLRFVNPKRIVENRQARLGRAEIQLNSSVEKKLKFYQSKVDRSMVMLDSLSPLRVLDRGYTLVQDSSGKIITSENVKSDQKVKIRFSKTEAEAEITSVSNVVDEQGKL